MDAFRENPKAGCGICTATVLLIVGLVVLFFSAGTVEPIAYGIKYNKFSKNVDETAVYEGGWYLIGPLNSFIQFPKTQVNIDFSDLPGSKAPGFQTLTGGSTITLHFSFQYQLIKEDIPKLYKQYALRYEENFIRVARGAISAVVSNLTIESYYKERSQVGDIMKQRLDKDLRDQFAICTGVQILKIELPQQQEDKLVEVQVSEQLTQQRLFAQQAQQVNKNIEVDTSVAQAVIRDIDAKAAAEAKAVTSDADA